MKVTMKAWVIHGHVLWVSDEPPPASVKNPVRVEITVDSQATADMLRAETC